MTLIAAFRCTDGGILCADSQETVGERRVSVQKIEPFNVGNLQIAIAGSGENGDLIEAFIETFQEKLEGTQPGTLKQFKNDAQECLLGFMGGEASLYPENERSMRFAVAARIAKDLPVSDQSKIVHGLGEAQIWTTRSSRLIPVKRYALLGWDDSLYRRAVDRLFRVPISISRAIPLAMYLFSLAEDTSNYVRGPVSVAVVTNTSPILMESMEAIEEFEAMTEVYTAALEDMLLACADTALSNDEFAEKFATFSENIFRLRQAYFEAVSDREANGFFSGRWPGVPYQRLSRWTIRTLMGDGRIFTKEDRNQVEEHRKRVMQLIELSKKNLNITDASVRRFPRLIGGRLYSN